MTTSTWTVGSGNWNDGSSWSAGIPAVGDVAVINDAAVTLTSSMVTAGTLDGVTLDLNPISGLSFNVTDVTFGPASAIDLTGPVTLDSNGQVVSAGAAIIGTDATAGVLTLNL